MIGRCKKAITATDHTLKCLKGIDLDTLGADREIVVSKLEELLQEIQNMLGSVGVRSYRCQRYNLMGMIQESPIMDGDRAFW